ncbi:hypothetical protein [Kribbella kalugense]|uniref:hypothetical protein n=1 Tax=Kribbella kalugense TaxID=2512221 RepID=UPI001066DC94|nr:hypothetical protein [Kribbella kalugense]
MFLVCAKYEEAQDTLVTWAFVRRQGLDELGDVGRALNAAEPAELSELYEGLKLSLTYNYADRMVGVEIDPQADRVVKSRVRGGT